MIKLSTRVLGVTVILAGFAHMSAEWNEFSCILKPSTIPGAGIGVFAAQNFKKGDHMFKKEPFRIRKTANIPQAFVQYCIHINDAECRAPERFDALHVGWFINHSATPNIAYLNDQTSDYWSYATRDIQEGEEIVMDYNTLGEPDYLKEVYYK